MPQYFVYQHLHSECPFEISKIRFRTPINQHFRFLIDRLIDPICEVYRAAKKVSTDQKTNLYMNYITPYLSERAADVPLDVSQVVSAADISLSPTIHGSKKIFSTSTVHHVYCD